MTKAAETGTSINYRTLLLFQNWRESGLNAQRVEEAIGKLSLLRETGSSSGAEASTIEDATLLLSDLRELLLSLGL